MWFITSVSSFHWYIFLYIQKQLFCYMCNAWIWWELRTRCARLKGNRSFFQILPRLSIYKRLKHHIRIHFIPHVRILLRATIKYNDHGSVLSAGVKSQTFLHWKNIHIYTVSVYGRTYTVHHCSHSASSGRKFLNITFCRFSWFAWRRFFLIVSNNAHRGHWQ